jgi:hypothetical protein
MHRLASRLSRGDLNQVFDLSGTKLDLSVTDSGDFNFTVGVAVWGR